MNRFIAPNLLGLHPPLTPSMKQGKVAAGGATIVCETCFEETAPFIRRKSQNKRINIAIQIEKSQISQSEELSSMPPLMMSREFVSLEDARSQPRGMIMVDKSMVRFNMYIKRLEDNLFLIHICIFFRPPPNLYSSSVPNRCEFGLPGSHE